MKEVGFVNKCETCKANKICDHNNYGFENCCNYISADVAPKEKIIREVVSDIKKLIHSHARYPRSVEIDNYITLKVVDAILNDYLKKYSKQERT
jgi:hypothetical protein